MSDSMRDRWISILLRARAIILCDLKILDDSQMELSLYSDVMIH